MASAATGKTRRAGAKRSFDERPMDDTERPTIPRTGARRTVMYYVKQFPAYLRLLGGLLTDRRVSALDKLLVAGAIAYIVMPIDLIPDFIPFLGEVDDLYLLIFALQRLISNAGRNVVYAHWTGAVEDLKDLNLQAALSAAAFFLPKRIRRRLRVIGRQA